MNTLEPGESFPICRQLDDPAETGTKYVQAKIRNSITDALLDTVSLTDKGDQRFRGTWNVPQDPSGSGLYVTITVRVYNDSSYSVTDIFFAVQEEKYLIQERYNRHLGGAGGGVDVDYKKVRKIVKEEIEILPKPVKPEKIKLKPFVKELKKSRAILERMENEKGSDIERILRAIKYIPEVDLLPFQETIQGFVQKEAQRIVKRMEQLPEPEKVNFSPVTQEMKDSRLSLTTGIKKLENRMSGSFKSALDFLKGNQKQIRSENIEALTVFENRMKEIVAQSLENHANKIKAQKEEKRKSIEKKAVMQKKVASRKQARVSALLGN